MIKITLVFYQFPEASKELENWEKEQKDSEGQSFLIKKVVDESKGKIIYTLADREEKLFCFDINNFTLEEVESAFMREDMHLKHDSYIYNKTLIFGKVSYLNLIKVQKAIERYEL